MKTERSHTASFAMLTLPSCWNQRVRTDTLIIRAESSDGAGDFIPGPSARTGSGEEVHGGMPCSQPFAKTKVRATINWVLLADSGLRVVFLSPEPLEMGPQLRSTRGLLDPKHVYGPSTADQVEGQDPGSQGHFGPWKPPLFSVAKLIISAASGHLTPPWVFYKIPQYFCVYSS